MDDRGRLNRNPNFGFSENFQKRVGSRLPSALVSMTHSTLSGQRLSAIRLTRASRYIFAVTI